jgi:hypothetical protein
MQTRTCCRYAATLGNDNDKAPDNRPLSCFLGAAWCAQTEVRKPLVQSLRSSWSVSIYGRPTGRRDGHQLMTGLVSAYSWYFEVKKQEREGQVTITLDGSCRAYAGPPGNAVRHDQAPTAPRPDQALITLRKRYRVSRASQSTPRSASSSASLARSAMTSRTTRPASPAPYPRRANNPNSRRVCVSESRWPIERSLRSAS